MNLSKHQFKTHSLNTKNWSFHKNLFLKSLNIKRSITTLISNITTFSGISVFLSKKPIFFSIFSIFIFLGITSVNSASSYALSYESQAGVGFIVNETINLSISGDITIPELTPGNSIESNTVDIKVSTNSKNGYSLSAKMGTTSADLIAANSSSSDPKFTGLSTSASESTLADNTWGYKIKTGDNSWSNYSGLPISTDTEKTLIERNTKPTGGEEITQFKIGAHASTSMPANTYSNTIIFHAVAKQPPTHTITWGANDGTVSPATSSIQYGKPIGTLPTPTYEGYNFLGWFTEAEGGEKITAETKVTEDVTYYAHWGQAVVTFDQAFYNAGAEKLNGYYKMQDMTTEICNSIIPAQDTTAAGTQITTLIDIRDNNTYTVAKLLDGNCWMTQNLALGGGTPITLTPDDTDIAKNWTLPASKDKFDDPYPLCWDTTFNGGGEAMLFNKNFASEDWKLCHGDPATYNDNIGNYYNWKAATADSAQDSMPSPYSICPKGWKLPSDVRIDFSGEMGEEDFNTLMSFYPYDNTNMAKLPPLSFVDSGVYEMDQFLQPPQGGIYIISSVDRTVIFYDVSGRVNVVFFESGGLPIRCLAR